jgi:uncharacterized protein (UPF0297 family)
MVINDGLINSLIGTFQSGEFDLYFLKKARCTKVSSFDQTMRFNFPEDPIEHNVKEVVLQVYEALQEKGYNPINQIVGYLLSGDPAYIPRHKDARNLIRKLERDEIIEELMKSYLKDNQIL